MTTARQINGLLRKIERNEWKLEIKITEPLSNGGKRWRGAWNLRAPLPVLWFRLSSPRHGAGWFVEASGHSYRELLQHVVSRLVENLTIGAHRVE